jgi:uncharacterized membrane protein
MAATAKTKAITRGRYWEIDLLRTFAIIAMVTFHVLYLLDYFHIKNTGVPGPYHGFWWWVPIGIVTTFSFLAGLSVTITYSRGKRLSEIHLGRFRLRVSSFVLRGLEIFGWGMGITLVTWIIAPYEYVKFGILHFFGVAFILAAFFARFRYVNLILGVAATAAGIYVAEQGIFAGSPWLLWLIPYPFATMDYWPLLPFFGIFLLGMFCGTVLYPQGKRGFAVHNWNSNLISALTLPGRYPLVAYLAQWPILVGAFLVLFPSHVLPYFPPLPF